MKKYTYQLNKEYDKQIEFNHKKVKIYSKKKFKEFNVLNSNILGEIKGICLDKHKTYDYFYYDGTRYKIYELNKSFHLLNKTLGYLEVEDKKYIKVLRRNYLIIPVLIGLILVGLLCCYKINPIHSDEISQSSENEIVYLKGNIYQDEKEVVGADIDLIHDDEVLDTTTSGDNGVYLFTGLVYDDYYLRVSYEDIGVYRYLSIQDKENVVDVNLPNYSIYEDIVSEYKNIYLDGLDKLITDPKEGYEYKIQALINKIDEMDNYISFQIDLVLEEYLNENKVHSYVLDELDKDISIIISDLTLYDVSNVYKDNDGTLVKIEDYLFSNNTLKFSIKENGIYRIEIKQKDNNHIGTSTFSYKQEAYYDINTQTLNYEFKQSSDSTNKTKIKVYLYSNDELIEAGQSEMMNIGEESNSLVLTQKLEKGIYDGLLRVYYYDSDSNEEIVDIDIPITIISND